MNDDDAIAYHWDGEACAPPAEAFHVERVIDPFTLKEVVGMVRHPGRPYVVRRANPDLTLQAQCRSIAVDYLDALQRVLRLPAEQWIHPDVRAALEEARRPGQRSFGFLPITWPEAGGAGPRQRLGSFWANRRNEGHATTTSCLLVLLAGSVCTERQLQGGTDMGLRLVIHLHADHVRIHGVTMVGLTDRRALDAVPAKREQDEDIFGLVREVRKVVGRALDCHRDVWVYNLENACGPDATPHHLFATGYALRKPRTEGVDSASTEQEPPRARTYDFRVELAVDPCGGVQMVQVHRDVYIGAGAVSRILHSFVQDPQSNDSPGPRLSELLAERRCTLSDEELGKFRDDVDATLARNGALQFSDGGIDLFEIQEATEIISRRLGGHTVASNHDGVVISGAPASAGPGNVPPVRSDRQAAVDAHLRAAELFGRMLAYGLDPVAYFRFARLPLVQRARPAMRWAPDGELPDAEVRPFLGERAVDDKVSKPSDPLQLLVNYGSADPVHRHKLPLTDGKNGTEHLPERLKAQYLSVASDPRWAWHEFCHVLNFASTGELEFPFAHSAGDALAAIVADPISRLAEGDPEALIRYATYPWIEVPGRSHGRSATRGYAWCGCRNLSRLDFTASLERYHHTYFGEQILSSSLFRLYRSLGGDTRAPGRASAQDELVRLSASDYCVYLIMRGISLLGPDTLAPARTPDQFVSALIEADLATGAWTVDATWPFNRAARQVRRQGGLVHKVVRWAFEQQGLYATPDPRETAEGPGLPPPVDVYIADRRREDGEPGDGGYAPVPLRQGEDEPWHAHGGWLRRQGRQLKVTVANRGREAAVATGLRVWASPHATAGNLTWTAVATAVEPQDVASADKVDFELQLPVDAGTGALWILVSVDSPADPSNLAGDRPPSSSDKLLELVAHDNNLALARL